jgi:hypothetical protein
LLRARGKGQDVNAALGLLAFVVVLAALSFRESRALDREIELLGEAIDRIAARMETRR